ncbi:M48 family metallopeptidase [Neisseria sp. Ec49-e6-T10]|uniref:M48 family metallopeptidase n=1 Tax=Neisseria sp. Ec49-e6-T10 TaxID=3140744 RepID=UPI003EBE9205
MYQIKLQDQALSFQCEPRARTAKYRLKLILHPQKGIIVRHAKNVSLNEIYTFLHQNQNWLTQKLSHPTHLNPKKLAQFSVEHFVLWYLGQEYPVTFHAYSAQKIKLFKQQETIGLYLPTHFLTDLTQGTHLAQQRVKKDLFTAICQWYKSQARLLLPKLLQQCTQKCHWVSNTPSLTIKTQKTRWGSCSSKNNINLNAFLMQFEQTVIESVILHELCHIKHMNHSRDFYQLLLSVAPHYQQHDVLLKNAKNPFNQLLQA